MGSVATRIPTFQIRIKGMFIIEHSVSETIAADQACSGHHKRLEVAFSYVNKELCKRDRVLIYPAPQSAK